MPDCFVCFERWMAPKNNRFHKSKSGALNLQAEGKNLLSFTCFLPYLSLASSLIHAGVSQAR